MANEFKEPIIKVDLSKFIQSARKHIGKEWPMATVKAFSLVAETVRDVVRNMTRYKYKLHSEYILNGIRHTPITKGQKLRAAKALARFGDMNAAIYLRPSNKPSTSLEFMADHEFGRDRQPQNDYIAAPTEGLKEKSFKTPRGRVKQRYKPATLLKRFKETKSRLKQGTTQSSTRGPRKRRLPGAPFIIHGKRGKWMIARRVMPAPKTGSGKTARRGHHLEFLYVLIPRASIKKEWRFEETVVNSVKNDYVKIINREMNKLPNHK